MRRAETRKGGTASPKGGSEPARPAKGRWRWWLRRALIVAAAIVILPVVLVPLYTVINPVSTLMIYSRVTAGPLQRDWVPLDDIADVMVASVMMSEDARFCAHGGVDWDAIGAVLDDAGGPSRGASTIAMQTVRNLFLWTSRSYIRKGLEIPLALYADLVWSKRRQIEIYLNIAEWGPRLFGVEAAAQAYFGRPAKTLTARQAALLAAALPNPFVRNPSRPGRQMQAIARIIEARARASGAYIGCVLD